MTQANTTYDDLRDSLESDPDRESMEKETAIQTTKVDDYLRVYTAQRSLMNRFLAHPKFELVGYETTTGDGGYKNVSAEQYEADGHDGRKPVYAIRGTMPIGVLRIGPKGRQSDVKSEMVTDEYI